MARFATQRHKISRPHVPWRMVLPFVLACAAWQFTIFADARDKVPRIPANLKATSYDFELTVTPSFSEKQFVKPSEQIELLLSRELKESDGTVAVLIGLTDVTGLFTKAKVRLTYNAYLWPLPSGESPLTVYLVGKDDDWKEIAEFRLQTFPTREVRP